LCDITERVAHVNVVGGTLDVKVRGGDPLVADEFVAIFDLFVEEEFRADVEARRVEHGDRADEYPLARTDRQRRFDAMIAMARHARAHLAVGKPAGAAVVVTNIVADLRTWSDALENAGLIATGDGLVVELDDDTIDAVIATAAQDPEAWVDRQCHTADGTPIHPITVLKASLTGLVRRVVVDSDGVILDRGRAARLFDGEARTAANLLFRECSHPGCSVMVRACDVDHVIEWWAGGRTNQNNADVRCSTHNRAKHRERWRSLRDEHGRRFTIRADGSIMLPVGARPPDLTQDELAQIARQRLHDLQHAS
ncbi:MAG TPA: HNH endonuclease, partial [Ilumatobacter sp.]|nr:HNH endonuclease [Ilumatobacter sp.]